MRIRLLLLFLLICFLCPSSVFAQFGVQDIVTLENGTIYKGKIIEQVPGKHVKVQLIDGSIFVVKESDIVEMEQESEVRVSAKPVLPLARKPISFKEKGVYTLLAYDIGTGRNRWNRPMAAIGLQYSLGYRFNRYVNVGAGVGVDRFPVALVFPVFGEVRGDLFQKKWTPHYFVKGGFSLLGVASRWDNIDELTLGYYYHAGLGYKRHTSGNSEWIISIGFKQQPVQIVQVRQVGAPNGGTITVTERGRRIYNRIVFGISWGI